MFTPLEEINLKNVQHIEQGAFAKTNIKQIEISDYLESIASNAFVECDIEKITVDKKNVIFDSRDDCNAIIHTKTNSLYIGCKNTKIPDTIKSIQQEAFSRVNFKSTIKIPNDTILYDNAFNRCGFKNLDIRNVIIRGEMFGIAVSDTLIISDYETIEKVFPTYVWTVYPKNIFINGSLDKFIENNKEFYSVIKNECNIQSLSLDEILENKSIKEINNFFKNLKDLELECEK